MQMNKSDKIYVAGHRGMVGSAIVRKLQEHGHTQLALRSSDELDLRNQDAVNRFFTSEKPDFVFMAAARVGGIMANNTYRAEFIYDNIMIQSNIIQASYMNKVTKLLFLGSSCIYPKMSPQPMREEYLLTGTLETTNEPYAIAKIAGIKMCDAYRAQYGCNFISVMPTNLYGPNDNYDLNKSHVLPALIRKFHEAKINKEPFVTIWGTGKPRRELMHADDLADACYFLMDRFNESGFINVGTGQDIEIGHLATLVKEIVGYTGEIRNDLTKPDGTPRKLMDVSKLNTLGWKARTPLEEGIKRTYNEYRQLHQLNA